MVQGRVQEPGSVSGLLTCFWLRVRSRARAGWPGPLAGPLLGPGRREAQAGALRGAAGPRPLSEVASGRLGAVPWSFESGTALGSSLGLRRPAPLPSAQLAGDTGALEYPGIALYE